MLIKATISSTVSQAEDGFPAVAVAGGGDGGMGAATAEMARSTITDDTPAELIVTLEPKAGKSGLCGVASAGDCICAAGSNKPNIWLYNLKTREDKQHKLQDLEAVSITAFPSDSDRCAFVLSSRKKMLLLVHINPETLAIRSREIYDISYEPGRISMVPGEQVLVLVNRTDEKIVLFDFDKMKTVAPKKEFPDMRCALTNRAKNEYVVLEGDDPGRVIWIDEQGKVRHSYCASDERECEYLNNPYAIVQDRTGRLIVADTANDRLHLIRADKKWSKYLLTEKDGLRLPDCLFLDEKKKQLIVADGLSPRRPRIRVYKWVFKFN